MLLSAWLFISQNNVHCPLRTLYLITQHGDQLMTLGVTPE